MESLKNLFMALIAVIVSKMAEVKEGLSNRIDELSNGLSSLKTYAETKIPEAFTQIEAAKTALQGAISSVASDLSSYKTEVTSKLDALKVELTTYIQTEVASLVQRIGEDDGKLQELVDSVTALAQADQGLVSTAGPQNFDDDQKFIARENIGAAGTQYVQAINDEILAVKWQVEQINNNAVDYEALRAELVDFLNQEFASRGL